MLAFLQSLDDTFHVSTDLTDQEIQAASLWINGQSKFSPDTNVAVVTLTLDLGVVPEDFSDVAPLKSDEAGYNSEDEWPTDISKDELEDPPHRRAPPPQKRAKVNRPLVVSQRKKVDPFYFPQTGERDLSLKYQCHR